MKFSNKDQVMVYDTDYQGVVHYASYFRFVTDALFKFESKYGISDFSFVTAEVHIEYKRPLHLFDKINVVLEPHMLSKKAIRFDFKIYLAGKLISQGYTIQVCINRKWHAIEMPKRIQELLGKKNSK